jgi:hypothetical protein
MLTHAPTETLILRPAPGGRAAGNGSSLLAPLEDRAGVDG